MSEECTHNCDTCSLNCSSKGGAPESLLEAPNAGSHVKKIVGVVSGKGGVGKSLVTGLLAVLASRAGFSTAILDADITGPSVPRMFTIKEPAGADETNLLPAVTPTGIKLMSINLLLENDTDPVVWRGPIIAGTVKQFWTDVAWGDVDIMFIDMPPGTGDVPLTIFQSLPVDGIVVVTEPQQLVKMIVEKAIRMADMMNIPVLGVVENMSYATCPDCGKPFELFGPSQVETVAAAAKTTQTARIPIQPKLAAACDKGMLELFEGDWLDSLFAALTDALHLAE